MENNKPSKPLSCFYCERSVIIPGTHATYFQAGEQPAADCTCPDVHLDLYAVHAKRYGKRRFVVAESWMPYHCGHFSARIIRVKCSYGPCIKTIDAPEWLAAKTMYIKNTFACYTIKPFHEELN